MSRSALTELLSRCIQARGITQSDFAVLVAAEQATVSRWLSGAVIPRPAAVPLIAKALDVEEREVWTARSSAQEEKTKRAERGEARTNRDLDTAFARVSEFVQTYEAFHAAYRQMGEQIDALVSQVERLAKDVADVKRDVRSLRSKEGR